MPNWDTVFEHWSYYWGVIVKKMVTRKSSPFDQLTQIDGHVTKIVPTTILKSRTTFLSLPLSW